MIAGCLLLSAGFHLQGAAVDLENPGFEKGLTGWDNPSAKTGGGCQVLAAAAHSGESGLRIEGAGADAESGRLPASPDLLYTVHFWARVLLGKGVGVYLRFYDVRGRWLTTIEAKNVIVRDIPPTAQEWTFFSLAGPTPPDATSFNVAVHSYSKAEVRADLDDFSVETSSK